MVRPPTQEGKEGKAGERRTRYHVDGATVRPNSSRVRQIQVLEVLLHEVLHRARDVRLAHAVRAAAGPVRVPAAALVPGLLAVQVDLAEEQVLLRAVEAEALQRQHLRVAHHLHQVRDVPDPARNDIAGILRRMQPR